ncbi:transcriptional regulator [Arthrobacter terricola]|uniref:Transcriptional regulator n=1 Tax=Arthrobacter terricola TaxID=2547396 RepID=A0A4V2ZS18_9MICC|nr:transcriptional regulator [Arthrobacter terricola]
MRESGALCRRPGDYERSYRFETAREPNRRLCVSQNRVSRIEHGDIGRPQVDTLRKYVAAVGGRLRVEVEPGDERIQPA